ncbi:uncharacterized protein LOC125042503 [Penaeus chinensis]|uniref:uncharacterized protein LOC125042503 n=1 Tax=Penaeus chinensis TaxID=139456 RepID=UPI001FB8096D|nr:uncharacterized protein LOC125042503 [Penaeus chinensis]
MVATLYYMKPSPFTRPVLLTMKALGVTLDLKEVNTFKGEQLKPEFVAINPQHTVPTLVDGDLTVCESKAICTYLIAKHGKDDDPLYPRDPKVRARVDSLLYFDMGTLWSRFSAYFFPIRSGKATPEASQESLDKFHEALGWLDGFLTRGRFAAGTDHVTIADLVLVANVSGFEAGGLLPDKYCNIRAWLDRCKSEVAGYEEANGEGVKFFGEFVKSTLKGAHGGGGVPEGVSQGQNAPPLDADVMITSRPCENGDRTNPVKVIIRVKVCLGKLLELDYIIAWHFVSLHSARMTIDFYYFLPSPFCRSVLLTARALGLNLNLKETDVWEGEQKKPEFVALNPQHSVPTLVDGDLTLWESRAICTYLVSRYGKDDSLYPRDPKVRARIDGLLYFDMGTLWPRFRNTLSASPTQESLDKFHEALGWLDGYLGRGRFAAGTDHVTVADHVLVANVASFEAAGRLPGTHQQIGAWMERCKREMAGYEEANGKGARRLAERLRATLSGGS